PSICNFDSPTCSPFRHRQSLVYSLLPIILRLLHRALARHRRAPSPLPGTAPRYRIERLSFWMCDAPALEYVQLCRFRIAFGFAEFTVQNGEADATLITPNKVPSRKPTLLQCGDDDGFSTALFIFPAVAVATHDYPARRFPIYALHCLVLSVRCRCCQEQQSDTS